MQNQTKTQIKRQTANRPPLMSSMLRSTLLPFSLFMGFAFVFSHEIFSLPADVICDKNLIEGMEAQKDKRYDDAAAAYQKIEKSKCKKSNKFYFHYGKLLVHAKDYPKAISMLETYINRTGKKGKYYKEALSLYIQAEKGIKTDRENKKEAVTDHQLETYRALAKKMRSNADDQYDEYKERLYEYESEAKSHQKKAKKADSEYNYYRHIASENKRLYSQGYCNTHQSQYCTQWQNNYNTANYNAQYALGERDGHIRQAYDSLDMYKEELEQIKRRGESAYQDGKDAESFEDKIYHLTVAIKIKKRKEAGPYYHRGLAYLEMELYEEALSDFSEAIDIDDDRAEYYFSRGQTYEKLGQKEKAGFDYNEALRLTNSKDQKTALRKKIQELGYKPNY